ncbi:MAG: vitamin B12-transporter protein BtuF [Candidatus Accumulibacter phosphatis]|uniref:Vitamin B12-transporter protein BtuF n=1 Tax=Candidatus Accumulibacter phosphatis TaxID=327160 RepID=A0A080LRG3_9PROT|nr:MAG: vitamin B12-transporter protein BtuF [Candidatus Accumulibacter phosphatis]HRF11006.1 helical backbone metal receptor [Candidatus Accumulibacter phosphatis]
MQWSDALGKLHTRYPGTPRIVSLVPSLTELLVDLGLAALLVGRTGFCIHPRQVVRRVPKLGGTKGFDIDKLRALQPTHVLVNIDENRREEVEALSDFVPHLIVTHPLAARDNLELYRMLGGIFGREKEAEALCADFEHAWAALGALANGLPRQQVLYLIWREPWLSVARDTYISRMLAAAGWDTLPLASLVRYPEIDLPELVREAEIVFLSSEPYPFRARHLHPLTEHLPGIRVALIDGEMVSWYGSRAIQGLAYLRELRASLAER